METMLIQLTNPKASGLLHELEELHLIKVLKENIGNATPKLSDKYKGFVTKEEGQKLNDHIQQMRNEWNNFLKPSNYKINVESTPKNLILPHLVQTSRERHKNTKSSLRL